MQAAADQHGPHLHHGPLGLAAVLAAVGLHVAVAVQLLVGKSRDGILIGGLSLSLAPCAPYTLTTLDTLLGGNMQVGQTVLEGATAKLNNAEGPSLQVWAACLCTKCSSFCYLQIMTS